MPARGHALSAASASSHAPPSRVALLSAPVPIEVDGAVVGVPIGECRSWSGNLDGLGFTDLDSSAALEPWTAVEPPVPLRLGVGVMGWASELCGSSFCAATSFVGGDPFSLLDGVSASTTGATRKDTAIAHPTTAATRRRLFDVGTIQKCKGSLCGSEALFIRQRMAAGGD